MSQFKNLNEKVATYREVFGGELGRKVLEDILSNLHWLPGSDPLFDSVIEQSDIETLRNFAIYLLGAGGLGIINDKSNEEIVRKLLEVTFIPRSED